MVNETKRWADGLKRALGLPAALDAKWASAQRHTDVVELGEAINEEHWGELVKLATTRVDRHTQALNDLAEEQATQQRALQHLASVPSSVPAMFATPGAAEWKEVQDKVVAEVRKRGSHLPAAAITALMDSTQQDPLAALGDLTAAKVDALDALAIPRISLLVGAHYAAAVGRSNQHAASAAPGATSGRARERLLAAETHLWESAKDGADLHSLAKVAGTLAAAGADLVEPLAGQVGHHDAQPLDDQSGPAACEAADTLRASLRAIALGHYVRWLASWGVMTPRLETVVHAAKRLPFAAPAEDAWTPLAAIAADPNAYQGKTLRVAGTIEAVDQTPETSGTVLTDGAGARLSVRVGVIRMSTLGVRPGGYLRCSGTLASAANGDAQLDIAFGDDGSTSDWQTWMSLRIRPVYLTPPFAAKMSTSWELGKDGEADLIRRGKWFS